MAKEAYKDHRPGSTKGEVHRVFDTKGKDSAIKYATAHEIQESTARTWCSSWGGGKAAKKTVKKAAAAKVPAKAPAKKTVAKKKRVRSTPDGAPTAA